VAAPAASAAFATAGATTATKLSTNGHRLPSRSDYVASDDDWVEF
jgi:hypothetical protein